MSDKSHVDKICTYLKSSSQKEEITVYTTAGSKVS